jgi:four helix bundle protein
METRQEERSEEEQKKPGLPHHGLRVWWRSLELVKLVKRCPPGNAELRDQATRAAMSVGLNISEGAALDGAAKLRHYKGARASLVEVVAAYEMAQAIGESVPVSAVLEQGRILYAMLTKLIRR